MTDQLRKRMMKKRRVKTLAFAITSDICIEVNTYALTRPTTPGMIVRCDQFCFLPLLRTMPRYCVQSQQPL
jgi:ATP-dependent DNA helicase 2 subunit 1